MAYVYAGVVAQPHYLAYSNSGLGFKASFVELRDDAYDAEQTAPFFRTRCYLLPSHLTPHRHLKCGFPFFA